MAKALKIRLRMLWLQVHKWIGLVLAVLIIPISLTGTALVWDEWLGARVDPQRYEALGPADMPSSAYAAAAAATLDDRQRLTSLRFNTGGEPVVAVAQAPARGQGRPERTSIWLDPRDASVIDSASANEGLVRVLHRLHGSMMIPGGWGRPIVGWVGAFMISCLTGLWLWWPIGGTLRSGFRWKRRNTLNANLHYLTGFWILIPLTMLSFTGAWISFPKVFSAFETSTASGSGGSGGGGGGGPSQPLTATQTPVDTALAAAQSQANGPLLSIGWPTDRKAEWTFQFEGDGGPAEINVSDTDATVLPPEPKQPETLARKMRRWHDGTDMGPVWQTVIFVGGIIPALLSITGILIWWRARRKRREVLQLAAAIAR